MTEERGAVECVPRFGREIERSTSCWVERKNSSKNSLTERKAAVECAASVETKDLIETLFKNLNQAIR
ncbi:hypothetical protein, partial [Metapseudomonas otitidis]|uniref:hypothetical protein n=1 Tax=Metapseudomonas otitidis TaxID=319939 RepID=UPI00197CF42F